MGNVLSAGSRSQNRYLDNPRLPLEIQLMIAEQLCPCCSMDEDAIPSTEDARELQRALGHLAATCRHLQAVANQHRFHSFVMPCDPDFKRRRTWHGDLDEEIFLARRFNNSALPALLDRFITHGQLGHQLRYLSIREFTLQFKAGVTQKKLIRFMAASSDLGIPIPAFVPDLLALPKDIKESLSTRDASVRAFWLDGELWLMRGSRGWDSSEALEFDKWMVRLLLFGSTRVQKLTIDPIIAQHALLSEDHAAATLPSVVTMGIPQSDSIHAFSFAVRHSRSQMEDLLGSFPNVRYFENDEAALAWGPYQRTPVNAQPWFPNLGRLVLDVEQPGRLHHLTQVLGEFPNLQELFYHRRTSGLMGEPDPDFSNANVFDAVHHCLRRLTYTSVSTRHDYGVGGEDYSVEITCYEERRFSDVPSFGAFAVLEDLTIDQGLLGRMSTIRDRIDSPNGPYFPDLDWKLPQSLRRLAVKFVYDPVQLASQLTTLAVAKQRGLFPLLSNIFVVIVRSCTVEYDGIWPPHMSLLPSADVIRDCGELMRATGISLGCSTTEIDPPLGTSEDYPHDVVPTGTLIALDVRRRYFPEL